MRHKALPIVIACFLAAAVLAVTLLAPTPETEPSGDEPGTTDPLDVNMSLRLGEDNPFSGIPIERVDRGSFTRVDAGKVVRVTWDRATPLSKGVSEVTEPRARMFFEGGRAMQVTADEGRFVAPDRQPQSGLFRGNVVITLVDGEPGEDIDFDRDAEVEMRVFIDGEARFDLVLNQIETADRVHLTGPRVEFFGTGLELSYNQRRNRLGRLDVTFGEVLRLKPEPTAEPQPSPPTPPSSPSSASATTPPNTDNAAADRADTREAPEDAGAPSAEPNALAEASDEPPEEVTFYRARFENNVWITAPAEDAELTGDAFELVFAMTGGALPSGGVTDARPRPLSPKVKRARNATALTADPSPSQDDARTNADASRHWAYPGPDSASGSAAPFAEPGRSQRDADRSLFVAGEDDLIVRWSGRMRVLPIGTLHEDGEGVTRSNPLAAEAAEAAEAADVADVAEAAEHHGRDEEDLADLAGPDDVLMRVTGDPALIESTDGRRIAAGEIEYVGSTGRVRAWQRASMPVRLRSDDMGALRGTRLTWLPRQHRAEIVGPGELRREEVPAAAEDAADENRAAENAAAGDADADDQQPLLTAREGLAAAWRDRLVLRFAAGAQEQTSPDAPTPPDASENYDTGVGELRSAEMPASLASAEFHGDVRVTHPRLRLDARWVRLDFAPFTNADEEAAESPERDKTTLPRRLVAEGAADLQLLADTPGESARVRGGEIAIDLETDDGTTDTLRPSRLLATSAAVIERDGATLAAERVDARFMRASRSGDATADATPDSAGQDDAPRAENADLAGGDLALSDLHAQGNVQLEDPERGLVLTGQRLEVDPAAETSQLFGGDDSPAVARRDDGFITGERLVLNQHTQTIRVPGAGSFEALLDPDARDQTLNIDWSRSMRFRHGTGLAEFHGNVRALAIGRREVTELTSDSLSAQLDIGPASREANADENAAPDAAKSAAAPDTETRREPISEEQPHAAASGNLEPSADEPAIAKVKRVTARGDALLKARVFATDPLGRPRTRLRMQGPIINFENLPEENREQVQVIGEGSMQFEDYRTADARPADARPAGSEEENRLAGVTGRGATLLLWEDRLTLDAAANDLIAEGGVTLLHRPAGAAPGEISAKDEADDAGMLQLDAQRLVADLAETGGLGVWLGDASPAPDLEAIDADRDVRVVRNGNTILADHLRYTRQSDAIRFTADPDSFVRIQREGAARTPRARTVIYHLTEDRLQAFDIVGGAAAGP